MSARTAAAGEVFAPHPDKQAVMKSAAWTFFFFFFFDILVQKACRVLRASWTFVAPVDGPWRREAAT
eukprot:5651483-Prymnesium_polylepis.1